MIRKPNFFILGAPKCGTTALSQYLSENPYICFSKSKEPNFYCSDMGGMQQSFTESEYLKKEFSGCKRLYHAVGEGSVLYLYSKVAVPTIEKLYPDSLYIVLFRNPVDAVYSLHSQLLYNLDEDQKSFKDAWNLQKQRQLGEKIPKLCRDRKLLMYKDMVSFGQQLQRLYKTVDPKKVLVHLFDDICTDPKLVYEKTLSFLGVESDGRTEFPVINSNKQCKSNLLMRIAYRPPPWAQQITRILKQFTGVPRFGVSHAICQAIDCFNYEEVKRKPLPIETRQMLIEVFSDDIQLLQSLTKRDLSSWLET